MANSRSMTGNENQDASSNKRFKTRDNDGPGHWSDLNHDILFLVLMQLGVFDFPAFSGVCKSWRSLAHSNRSTFIVSRRLMSIRISTMSNEEDYYCYLTDFEGRLFRTILSRSAGKTCVGFTCGYLVFQGRKTRKFWLVNPITRHELHFPEIPSFITDDSIRMKAVLVFSPLISRLVFIVLFRGTNSILFCVAGTQGWSRLISGFAFLGLRAFMGKIYTLDSGHRLCELIPGFKPRLTILETKNNLKPGSDLWKLEFGSSGQNFYMLTIETYPFKVVKELDFGEMKWVKPRNTIDEYGFSGVHLKYGHAIETDSESWADPQSQYERYASSIDINNKSRKAGSLLPERMWYIPHECLISYMTDDVLV